MSKLLWLFCFGLYCCCWIISSRAEYVISCRFRGVFHVEKGNRYNLTAEGATRTCLELGTVIASKEQVAIAHQSGFEICRYGWVDNSTVIIPRLKANPICAANYVGIFQIQANLSSSYDVFCFNATDSSDKNCEVYNFKNEVFVPHDPTLEVVDSESGSSPVSPTHHELDPSNTEQWTASEDATADPEMSTEQSEHSGDHITPLEDGDIKHPYIIHDDDKELESQTDAVDPAFERDVNREDGYAPGTDPSSNWNSGYIYEMTSVHDDHPHDDHPHNEHPHDDRALQDSDSMASPAVDSQDNTQTKQKRRAAIPEWLIVCVSLVCLGLIFSVCIALNARRICGQKKKLVINGNKGHPEDGVIMEQNGDTVKSQEMVQLVSKDQSCELGEHGDSMNHDGMNNTKDMRIGV